MTQHSVSLPVDVDSVFLADPVGPRHGLQVVLGIPVTVEDNHSVSSGQVDAQAACPGGQKEGKVTRAWCIEVFHCLQAKPMSAVA